ncbi:MAG: hypothetical protein ACRYGR_08535 [Janthinobacterium lividum]
MDISDPQPWDMPLTPVSCWKSLDGSIYPIDLLSSEDLVAGIQAMWQDIPEYQAALAESLLRSGLRSMEARRVLDRPGRALLPLVAPTWALLVDEAEQRKVSPDLLDVVEPRDIEEISDVLDQVQRTVPTRPPAPLGDILRHRAALVRRGDPLLPWAWVDLYLRMDGVKLGKLLLYPLHHEGWTTPHPLGRVFGVSRGMLHILRPSGACMILSSGNPAKPPVYEATDFVSYLHAIMTLSLSFRPSEHPAPAQSG